MKFSRPFVFCCAFFCAAAATAAGIVLADHDHDAGDYSHHGETPTVSHGGGLDQCGGHYNRKTGVYHYHQKKC